MYRRKGASASEDFYFALYKCAHYYYYYNYFVGINLKKYGTVISSI